ncbi:MAG: YggS family pyridoxal phosphate-dependent enzyme, partial [Campylobacteraceae bacterium]|nr:YggS family pyridoxal phosphate-dependent enzyme [Campylobacteraceae bacterium]
MSAYETVLNNVFTRIEAVRSKVNEHQIVKIVAVSKSVQAVDVENLYLSGQRAFGENRVQELAKKQLLLEPLPLEWHFIGRLQKNKINALIDLMPDLMHSCDSLELAEALNQRLATKNRSMNALLQINSAYEDTKAGVLPKDALETYINIQKNYPHINLQGVMSIGAHTEDKAVIKKSFEAT